MNLFIGNLSLETTDRDLRRIFSEFGELVSVRVVKDNETGMSRGFGFVEMEDKFKAYDAIDNLDCTYLLGNIISVKEAKPKVQDRNNTKGPNRGTGAGNPYPNRTGSSYPNRNSTASPNRTGTPPPPRNRFNRDF